MVASRIYDRHSNNNIIGSKVSTFKYTRNISYILFLNLEDKYSFNASTALHIVSSYYSVYMSACGGQVITSDIERNE